MCTPGLKTNRLIRNMSTWIFQGNPDTFDIDGYLQASSGEFLWLASRYKDDIKPGDKVYVWRSNGKEHPDATRAGIVAEATVIAGAQRILDEPEARPYWKDPSHALQPEFRVRLRLVKLANKKEILRREWLVNDSRLCNLSILKFASGTNFPVTASEDVRLSELWSKTGSDWGEAEVVAALNLYSAVWDQPISKSMGSDVEQVAQLIGRTTTGVYNKLMNFRAFDTRVPASGLSGGSKLDAAVWDRYFDGGTRSFRATLRVDFERLWSAYAAPSNLPVAENISPEVKRLSSRSLADLFQIYRRKEKAPAKKQRVQSEAFQRLPVVVTITLKRADNRCEVVGCTSPVFLDEDGIPILEVHHLKRLADGGEDSPENTVCICPNHHRALHRGKDAHSLTEELTKHRMRDVLTDVED
jgi:hypothetical protein